MASRRGCWSSACTTVALLVRRALELGARGYVTKSSAPENLIEAVRCVIGGARYLSPELPRQLLAAPVLQAGGEVDSLTEREFEIYRLLATGTSLVDSARGAAPQPQDRLQPPVGDQGEAGASAPPPRWRNLALRHGLIAAG